MKQCKHHKHPHSKNHGHHERRKNNSREERNYPVPCVVPPLRLGGCCNDGICSIQDERDCLESGGAFAGIAKSCWEIKCPGNPVGSCCLGRFGCTQVSEQNCDNIGGMWLGPYSSCRDCNPTITDAYDIPLSNRGLQTSFALSQGYAPFGSNNNNNVCGLPSGIGRRCDAVDAGFSSFETPSSGVDVNYAFYSGGIFRTPPQPTQNFPQSITPRGWFLW